MKKFKHYFSLIKFSHTIFALPFAIVGAILGFQTNSFAVFPWHLFAYVILCMFFARSAAMSFNRYIDASFDKLNHRTQNREIPRGIFKRNTVLVFVIFNSLVFIVLTFFINKLVFMLSPIALLIILGYSYAKRFTMLSHVWLGVALGLSPIGAFFVFNPSFSWQPIFFSLIVLFWVAGFDIIYSTQDIDIDRKLNLKSIPAVFGYKNALKFAIIFHIISIIVVITTGIIFDKRILYWVGAFVFSILLMYEHLVVKRNSSEKNINMAFSILNSYAGLMFGIFVILDLLL